jgi:hypothetical protein
MTTGRINQVTIVRRGRPTGAVFHAPERISKLLAGGLFLTETAAHREATFWLLGLEGTALWQIRFTPLCSPEHPSTHTGSPRV